MDGEIGRMILGPNDRMTTSALTDPVTVFDKNWAHTNVCVWDAAAAHLALEDALRSRPEELGGEAFLITGIGSPWTLGDTRDAVKVRSSSLTSHAFSCIRSYLRHTTYDATALLPSSIDVQTHLPTAHLRPRPYDRSLSIPPLLFPLSILPHSGASRLLVRSGIEVKYGAEVDERESISPTRYVGLYEGCSH